MADMGGEGNQQSRNVALEHRTASLTLRSPRYHRDILRTSSLEASPSPRSAGAMLSPNTPGSASRHATLAATRSGVHMADMGGPAAELYPSPRETASLLRARSLEQLKFTRGGGLGFSPYQRSQSLECSPSWSALSGRSGRSGFYSPLSFTFSPTRALSRAGDRISIEDTLSLANSPHPASIDFGQHIDREAYQHYRHSKNQVAKKEKRFVINATSSNFRKTWDILLAVLIVYNALAVPLRLGFDVEGGMGVMIFDMATDALFIFDIFLNFRTTFERDGVLVDKPSAIAVHYLRTWFVIDLVSALPVDLILLAFGMDTESSSQQYRINKLFKILKTFRLVRVLRLARLARIMARFRAIFNVKYSILTIFKFFIVVAFVAHWIACFWYLVADLEGISQEEEEGGNLTWVSEMLMPGENTHGTLKYEELRTKYIVCIYHAIMVMSTIGSHILPVTNTERVYSLITMFIGSSIYAYGITNMCSLIFNLNRQEVEYKQRMDMINDFMTLRGLPQALRNKVRQYYEHLHAKQRFFNEHEIIGELSRDLQTEVVLKLNEQMIRKNLFFQYMSTKAVTAMIQSLNMYSFLPGENIIYEGEIGNEMFFLYDGAVEVYMELKSTDIDEENDAKSNKNSSSNVNPKGLQRNRSRSHSGGGQEGQRKGSSPLKYKVLATLYPGDYFGEIALMSEMCTRTASVRALTFCDVYTLTKADVDEILGQFPEDKQKWNKIARKRISNASSSTPNSPAGSAILSPSKRRTMTYQFGRDPRGGTPSQHKWKEFLRSVNKGFHSVPSLIRSSSKSAKKYTEDAAFKTKTVSEINLEHIHIHSPDLNVDKLKEKGSEWDADLHVSMEASPSTTATATMPQASSQPTSPSTAADHPLAGEIENAAKEDLIDVQSPSPLASEKDKVEESQDSPKQRAPAGEGAFGIRTHEEGNDAMMGSEPPTPQAPAPTTIEEQLRGELLWEGHDLASDDWVIMMKKLLDALGVERNLRLQKDTELRALQAKFKRVVHSRDDHKRRGRRPSTLRKQ